MYNNSFILTIWNFGRWPNVITAAREDPGGTWIIPTRLRTRVYRVYGLFAWNSFVFERVLKVYVAANGRRFSNRRPTVFELQKNRLLGRVKPLPFTRPKRFHFSSTAGTINVVRAPLLRARGTRSKCRRPSRKLSLGDGDDTRARTAFETRAFHLRTVGAYVPQAGVDDDQVERDERHHRLGDLHFHTRNPSSHTAVIVGRIQFARTRTHVCRRRVCTRAFHSFRSRRKRTPPATRRVSKNDACIARVRWRPCPPGRGNTHTAYTVCLLNAKTVGVYRTKRLRRERRHVCGLHERERWKRNKITSANPSHRPCTCGRIATFSLLSRGGYARNLPHDISNVSPPRRSAYDRLFPGTDFWMGHAALGRPGSEVGDFAVIPGATVRERQEIVDFFLSRPKSFLKVYLFFFVFYSSARVT